MQTCALLDRASVDISARRHVRRPQTHFHSPAMLDHEFLRCRTCAWASSGHFTRNAKKFSPKQHRKRVGEMSGKKCPLHDKPVQKRPCKQTTNPLELCPHYQPNRSRYALACLLVRSSLHRHRLRARCTLMLVPMCLYWQARRTTRAGA